MAKEEVTQVQTPDLSGGQGGEPQPEAPQAGEIETAGVKQTLSNLLSRLSFRVVVCPRLLMSRFEDPCFDLAGNIVEREKMLEISNKVVEEGDVIGTFLGWTIFVDDRHIMLVEDADYENDVIIIENIE